MELTYPGSKFEAFLWSILGSIGILVAILVLFSAYNIAGLSAYLPNYGSGLFDRYSCVVAGVLLAKMMCQAAKMCGSSVTLATDHIRVTEWYGKKRFFVCKKPILVDQNITLIKIAGLKIEASIALRPLIYRLVVDGNQIFLNLDKTSNPEAEVQKIRDRLK